MEDKKTSGVPDTSTQLLRDVADSQHARWSVFHSRYEPMMRAYLREHFPSFDAEDIIQETFVALARALPRYVYNPKENGHFHNYLTGILRNKALRALVARKRDSLIKERAEMAGGGVLGVPQESGSEAEYKAWREAIYEIALQQLLADESIHERTKQVFVRLTIDGETPAAVAESLGIPRPTVNRMKERTLERLRRYVNALKGV